MILIGVRSESGCEPAALSMPDTLYLVCGNADLYRPLRDGAVQNRRLVQSTEKKAAVVVYQAVLLETVVLHPGQNLMEIGPFEDAMPRGPANYLLIRDKDLRLMTSLSEGFFGGNAVAMDVITPHGKLYSE